MPPASWTLRTLILIVALAPFDIGYLRGDHGARFRPLMMLAILVPLIALAERRLNQPADQARPYARRIDWGDRCLLAWLAAVWISTALADDRLDAAAFAFRFTVLAALVHSVRHVLTTRSDPATAHRAALLRWLVLGAALAVVVGLTVLLSGTDPFPERLAPGSVTRLGTIDRLTRPWSHANVAAMALGTGFPAAVVLRDRERGALAIPIIVALAVTYSRGAIVGLVCSSIVVLLLARSRRVTIRLTASLALGAALVAITPGWDGRGVTEQNQTWLAVEIEHPTELAAGSADNVTIRAVNGGTTSWQASGRDGVVLSARWIAAEPGSDELAVWFEQTWALETGVAPGDSTRWELAPAAALPEGTYEVHWDLLQAEEAYFLQFSGRSATTTWSVDANNAGTPAESPEPFVPRLLNLDRFELWRHALGVFSDAPFFGVGPGQLPAAAADRIGPDHQVAGGHSHNFWIELLATTGVVGTVSFAGLIAVGITRITRRLSRLRRTSEAAANTVGRPEVATIAALTALLAHGLVDLPLMFQGTVIPLGLHVGLSLGGRSP